jgi:RES domain-containing protein
VEELEAGALHPQLNENTPHALTRRIGDQWAGEGRSPVLKVPSVIVVGEVNYVLNPAHQDFNRIDITAAQPLQIDRRLLRGSRPH